MEKREFSQAQRQSGIGMLLIFFSFGYKLLRGFWPLLVLLFIKNSAQSIIYIFIGLMLVLLLLIGYSYLYYRRFLFHIDYDEEAFILKKGVFSSETINLPFDKIQQVNLKRSILQRLIGVYSLNIDTAGSKSNEIEIKALRGHQARKLAAVLTDAKKAITDKRLQQNKEEKQERESEAGWQFKLGVVDLLKVGLTRSFMRGFLIIMTFVFSLYSQLRASFSATSEAIEEFTEPFVNIISSDFAIVLFLVLVIFLLSILVTVGEVFMKYFNLIIKQNSHHIDIEMGLKTNTKVTFQPRRLQKLRIKTNPLQQYFDMHALLFALANSENKLKNSKISVPGLSAAIVEKIKKFLYETLALSPSTSYRPHWIWLSRRIGILVLFFGLLLIGNWQFGFSSWQWLIPAVTFCAIGLAIFQWMLFKRLTFGFTENFLIVKRGVWTKKEDIIELYKMEGVSIRQPFWYKQRQVYNVKFHTAGGDLYLRAVPHQFLKEINYLLFKIESSNKAWM